MSTMPDDSVPTITPYVAGRHEAATSGRIFFSLKHGGPQAPRPAALASCPPAAISLAGGTEHRSRHTNVRLGHGVVTSVNIMRIDGLTSGIPALRPMPVSATIRSTHCRPSPDSENVTHQPRQYPNQCR